MMKEVISMKSNKGRNKAKTQIVITDYEEEVQKSKENMNKKREENTDKIYKTTKE